MQKIKLGDVGEIFGGATPSTKILENYNGNISWITPKDLSKFNEVFISYGERNISEIGLKSCSAKLLPPNSILFSSRAPIGYVAIAKNELCTNQGFKNIIPNEKINYIFLYYLLRYNKDNIAKISTGTTFKEISAEELKNFVVKIPESIETQKQIGNLLYSLDEKILINKKINATLEAMAKTLYLHLFFRRPANGKIGDLIIENPKSTISVGDAKNSGGDFPFFTSGENILRWNEKLVDGRNIFMNDGGNVGINFYVGKAAYSTHTYCITAEKGLADYLFLFLESIQTEIEKRFFTGTGLKNLRKDLLRKHEIYIPTQTEIDAFNKKVQPCFDMISKNLRENNLLENLRDFLLPLLMNGQVTIKR